MRWQSGQWCKRHACHQDDPRHAYEYPECERHLRDATLTENLRAALAAAFHRDHRPEGESQA